MYEYKFETKLGSKIINCRAFTLSDYRDLIEAKQNGTIQEVVERILGECTDARDLTKQQAEFVLVNLWAQSLGEVNHQNAWVCSCGHEIPTAINFTQIQMDATEELWYDLTAFKIKLRYPRLFEDKNIAQMIASCIEYIFVDGEAISVDELNDNEIDDLYSAITEDDIKKISKLLLEPTIYTAIPIECDKCGESHVHVIRGLKEFFRLI